MLELYTGSMESTSKVHAHLFELKHQNQKQQSSRNTTHQVQSQFELDKYLHSKKN